MSTSHIEKILCENCNALQDFTIWDSINVTVDPKLKAPLLSGELTTFHCQGCGYKASVFYDFLYHDMDHSLAIWHSENEDNDSETDTARQLFLSATNLKTTRVVRSLLELYDKIRVFEDKLDDLEIEISKIAIRVQKQADLNDPCFYGETCRSWLGRKSLVFFLMQNGSLRTVSVSFKQYESTIRRIVDDVRPLLEPSDFEWARLDCGFILELMEDAGIVRAFSAV